MKKISFLILLFVGCMVHSHAQVGINTTNPFATLDVTKEPSGTVADGIIAPNLLLTELIARDALYAANQSGNFVYVTAIDATPVGKTINVTTPGYYYFDGSASVMKWKHFNDKIQTADNGLNVSSQAHVQLGGDLVKNTTIDTKTNTLTISNTGGTDTGLQLTGGGAAAGKVLTSDTNGNTSWAMPGFSVYESIPYQMETITVNYRFIYANFYIDFPSYGVYAINLGITLNGQIPVDGTYLPAVQLVPKLASTSNTDIFDAWTRATPRFLGSFESFGHNPYSLYSETIPEIRFAYNQNITVTSSTGLRAYLLIGLPPSFVLGTTVTMIIGNNTGNTRPQSSGGSFIRIN